MKTKVCKGCQQELSLDKFPKNGRSYRTLCRICENKRIRNKMLITVAYVQSFKTKCEICGYDRDKSALEFHHKNKDDKSFNISHFASGRIWSRKVKELIDNEIKKCICICANCHREIHSKQLSDDIMNTIDFSFNSKSKQQLAIESISMYNRKFSVADIKDIRYKYEQGANCHSIANEYDCCYKTIQRIITYKTYKYIE